MFENEDELKNPFQNKMHIAFLHPNPSQNDLTKKNFRKGDSRIQGSSYFYKLHKL